KEPGQTNFATGSLNFTLTGAPSTVHHTLLEKSDGSFFLMIWNDLSSYNLTTGQDTNNNEVAVTLGLPSAFNVTTYLTDNSTSPTATLLNQMSVNLSVPDQMMLVELTAVPEPGSLMLLGLPLLLGCRS